MNDTVPTKWVGGICIKEASVLLIYRINKEKDFNQEYFVFPGGGVQGDASIEDTLIREFDEASIRVKVGDLFYSTEEAFGDETDYYYLCDYILGEPKQKDTGDEVEIMEGGKQLYTPMWVPIKDLDDLIVYPETVKEKIIQELQYN